MSRTHRSCRADRSATRANLYRQMMVTGSMILLGIFVLPTGSFAEPNLITNSTFDASVAGWTALGGSTLAHSAIDGGTAEFSSGGGTVSDMAQHDACIDISGEPSNQDYFFDGDFQADNYTPTGNTLGFRFEFFTDANCTTFHSDHQIMGGFGQMGSYFNLAGSFNVPDASVLSISVHIGPRAELSGSRVARADNIEFSIAGAVPVELMTFSIE